jgi:uncharacterized cupredoxin-like copper-binding protein
MRRPITVAAAAVLVSLGCAAPSDTVSVPDDAIEITMRDNVFDPKNITVKEGEDVTFLFVNRGSLEHEAFIGSKSEQNAHEREMQSDDEGEEDGHGAHGGSDAAAVAVKPGRSATLEHRFTEAGTTYIGCHVPGHYDAGMRVKVKVV